MNTPSLDLAISIIEITSCAVTGEIIFYSLRYGFSMRLIYKRPNEFYDDDKKTINYQVKNGKVWEIPMGYHLKKFVKNNYNISNIINLIKVLVKNHGYVHLELCFEDSPDGHCFVVGRANGKNKIIDSYINQRKLEIRSFSFKEFFSLLAYPSDDKWNKLFNCNFTGIKNKDFDLNISYYTN